jgi:pimeloyl-ACP methyl ester carboxylesterase
MTSEENMQNDWIQGTVTVDDGIELFYTRTGKGDKPCLVLAHGLSDSGLCWHQLASDLEADYDILMYDAYGHGKSSRVDPDKRFDLVADLYDLMEALKIEKPGLVGHSMGAATVAAFAARYPDKLSALVLEDPPWTDLTFEEEGLRETLHQWKQQNLAAKKKTTKELQKLKQRESPNWEEAILPEWAQAKHDIDPEFFDLLAIRNGNWQSLAEKIIVPTLIITGDNELGAIVTPKLGVEAVQLLNQGEFGHISGAGHCVRYEQYQPYITMVKVFLKRNM